MIYKSHRVWFLITSPWRKILRVKEVSRVIYLKVTSKGQSERGTRRHGASKVLEGTAVSLQEP